jgi:hypothetical protein
MWPLIRQVICLCRLMLPEEKRTVACVEAEVRRLVERALKDLRDDATAFGARRPPGQPLVDAGQDANGNQRRHDAKHGEHPDGVPEVVPDAVAL